MVKGNVIGLADETLAVLLGGEDDDDEDEDGREEEEDEVSAGDDDVDDENDENDDAVDDCELVCSSFSSVIALVPSDMADIVGQSSIEVGSECE